MCISPSKTQVWRSAVALDRLRNDARLLREMIEFYLADYPKLLDEWDRSVAQGDAATAERAAHTLKGLAATFEAVDAVAAARAAERAAKKGDESQMEDSGPALRAAFDQLAAALRSY